VDIATKIKQRVMTTKQRITHDHERRVHKYIHRKWNTGNFQVI